MKQQITTREQQVLEKLSFGFSSKEIAHQLYLSTHTVISHRKSLMVKLDVKNSAGLVRKGFEIGMLHLNSPLNIK